MGAFFANVHVASGKQKPAALISPVSAAIDAEMKRAGLRRCGEREPPTRELLLLPNGRWLSVLDSAAERQDGEHTKLAASLARATKRPAATFLVHDSDVFEAELFDERGEQADRYVNRPDYFGKASAKEREAVQGAPQAWGKLAGADPKRVRAVFANREEVFCEEQTASLAKALGMRVEVAMRGHRYSVELDNEAPVRLTNASK